MGAHKKRADDPISMEPIGALKPGPVRHELSAEQARRVGDVHRRLGAEACFGNLEDFERDFMRDWHPDREILIWECFADAIDAIEGQFNRPIPRKLAMKKLLEATGGYRTADQIIADPLMARLMKEYLAAKARRTE